MIFWDTSALARCYFANEPHHQRALNILLSERGHQACSLIVPELVSAAVRRLGRDKRNRESLLALVDEHLGHFGLSGLDQSHIDLAVRLIKKHALRSADALHLASALVLCRVVGRRTLRFVTADAEQAAAAKEEGLKVLSLALPGGS